MTDHLEKIKLLNGLPDEVLNWLDKETEYKEVGKGDYLFHEGEEPARMYFVVSGGIKVVREFPSGKNSILGIFGPGQMVAEIAVVDQKPYPASAVAHEASLVGGVDAKIFRELLTKAPESGDSPYRKSWRETARAYRQYERYGGADRRKKACSLFVKTGRQDRGAGGRRNNDFYAYDQT